MGLITFIRKFDDKIRQGDMVKIKNSYLHVLDEFEVKTVNTYTSCADMVVLTNGATYSIIALEKVKPSIKKSIRKWVLNY